MGTSLFPHTHKEGGGIDSAEYNDIHPPLRLGDFSLDISSIAVTFRPVQKWPTLFRKISRGARLTHVHISHISPITANARGYHELPRMCTLWVRGKQKIGGRERTLYPARCGCAAIYATFFPLNCETLGPPSGRFPISSIIWMCYYRFRFSRARVTLSDIENSRYERWLAARVRASRSITTPIYQRFMAKIADRKR